jgi:hypothetical protein
MHLGKWKWRKWSEGGIFSFLGGVDVPRTLDDASTVPPMNSDFQTNGAQFPCSVSYTCENTGLVEHPRTSKNCQFVDTFSHSEPTFDPPRSPAITITKLISWNLQILELSRSLIKTVATKNSVPVLRSKVSFLLCNWIRFLSERDFLWHSTIIWRPRTVQHCSRFVSSGAGDNGVYRVMIKLMSVCIVTTNYLQNVHEKFILQSPDSSITF